MSGHPRRSTSREHRAAASQVLAKNGAVLGDPTPQSLPPPPRSRARSRSRSGEYGHPRRRRRHDSLSPPREEGAHHHHDRGTSPQRQSRWHRRRHRRPHDASRSRSSDGAHRRHRRLSESPAPPRLSPALRDAPNRAAARSVLGAPPPPLPPVLPDAGGAVPSVAPHVEAVEERRLLRRRDPAPQPSPLQLRQDPALRSHSSRAQPPSAASGSLNTRNASDAPVPPHSSKSPVLRPPTPALLPAAGVPPTLHTPPTPLRITRPAPLSDDEYLAWLRAPVDPATRASPPPRPVTEHDRTPSPAPPMGAAPFTSSAAPSGEVSYLTELSVTTCWEALVAAPPVVQATPRMPHLVPELSEMDASACLTVGRVAGAESATACSAPAPAVGSAMARTFATHVAHGLVFLDPPWFICPTLQDNCEHPFYTTWLDELEVGAVEDAVAEAKAMLAKDT